MADDKSGTSNKSNNPLVSSYLKRPRRTLDEVEKEKATGLGSPASDSQETPPSIDSEPSR